MNGQHLRAGLLVIGVAWVVALGRLIPAWFGDRLPQAQGGDVLALILGDARFEISRALEDKAEEYFHGGVRHPNCTMMSDAEERVRGEPGQGGHDGSEKHEGHDRHEEEETRAAGAAAGGDLWQRIDGRVHEQVHRHLKGDQTVDLLPWLWAAARMSPRNREAYESGAYVLASMLDKPDEGVRLLEEGVRKNPESPELVFSLGEMVFNRLHDAARAEACFASVREKCLPPQKNEARAEELALLRLRALFYLGYIAKQRGDLDRARRCLEEAESLNPKHVIVRNLRALLEKPGTGR